MNASFKDGVLTIILPKSAQPERSHKIEVQRGGDAAQQVADNGGRAGRRPS